MTIGFLETLEKRIEELEARLAEIEEAATKINEPRGPALQKVTVRECARIYRMSVKPWYAAVQGGELDTEKRPGRGGKMVDYINPADAAKFYKAYCAKCRNNH